MSQEQTMHSMIHDIAAIKSDISHANKRIEKNESRTDHIHKLAASLENLTEQLKVQNARWEKMFELLDFRMREHDSRLGEIEKKEIEIENKLLQRGAKRWEHIVVSVATATILAIIFYFLSNLGL